MKITVPVTIDLEDDTFEVNNIRIRFSYLQMLADPNPDLLYRYVVRGNDLIVETFAVKSIEELVR